MSLHPPDVRRRPEVADSRRPVTGAVALAFLRIVTGFAFLWAFVDKTFGLGYATPSAGAWIRGGSPTRGFLMSVDVGPFRSLAHSLAGQGWVDWLFMLGLLGVGAGLVAGVALRPAVAAGVLLLAMMWFLEFPPARHTAAHAPTMSTNPLVDYHLVYIAALLALGATRSGEAWGLGRRWAQLPVVARNPWLR